MLTEDLAKQAESLKIIDRTYPQTCPYCHTENVEITLYDFSTNKPFFADIWVCSNRKCGEAFIVKTKREVPKQ